MLDYHPNKEDHPSIKISGHPTGKAWEFKDDGLWSNTISDGEFNNPVNDMRGNKW